MATITLAANTDYSALTVANDDTIDLAGFALTLDVVPTESGVAVTTPATAGTVILLADTNYNMTGWSFTAGTTNLIGTLPSGTTLNGTFTGGTGASSRAVLTNNGTMIGNVTGGSGPLAYGVFANNGTITGDVTGGSSSGHGVLTNSGTITGNVLATVAMGVSTNDGTITGNVTGGTGNVGIATNNGTIKGNVLGGISGSNRGVTTNNGTVDGNVTGGAGGNARGMFTNNGTITGSVTGGTGSATVHGVLINYGTILGGLYDADSVAVDIYGGSVMFVDGPNVETSIPANIKTLYSLGTLSASATIAADADVIEVSKGKGLTGIR